MFVAVDIGNTNVSVGFIKSSAVLNVVRFQSSLLGSAKKTKNFLKACVKKIALHEEFAESVYVCSVVPRLNSKAASVLREVFKTDVFFMGKDIIVPIINRYRILSQVGQDRLVNAYAASKIYGSGVIIIDFGTAITFDIVSKKNEYIGGLIIPGLRLMQQSLSKGAELLPYVELSRPIELIGRDTISSIRAGIIYGAASICDGITNELLKKQCRGYKVVVTGGDAQLVKPFSKSLKIIDDNLIFKGLNFIFESHRESFLKKCNKKA